MKFIDFMLGGLQTTTMVKNLEVDSPPMKKLKKNEVDRKCQDF